MGSQSNSSRRPARDRTRQHVQVAPSVWPTLLAAAVAFWLAAHESLIWPQFLGCVLVALVATSLAAVAMPLSMSVSVDAPTYVRVGESFETNVRLRNRGATRRGVIIRQRWRSRRELVGELVSFVEAVSRRGEAIVRVQRVPVLRGAAIGAEVEIEAAGPFGFFTRTARHTLQSKLICVPGIARPLPVISGEGLRTGVVEALEGDTDLRGVRDWRPGDRIGRVHWRSVVRTGRMTVVEREGTSAGSVVVMVSAPGKRGKALRDPGFELAIATAAATATAAMRRGIPVCLIASAKESSTSSGNRAGVWHPADEQSLLDCLARIDVARVPSDDLLEHAMHHAAYGGTLLLVASNATPKVWRARLLHLGSTVGAVVVDVGKAVHEPARVPA